jgi:hypothetical protein
VRSHAYDSEGDHDQQGRRAGGQRPTQQDRPRALSPRLQARPHGTRKARRRRLGLQIVQPGQSGIHCSELFAAPSTALQVRLHLAAAHWAELTVPILRKQVYGVATAHRCS